ncbi:hypothetical protein [uncultured Ruegeria sp.]|uniref:hypothetical protein n=1 Tax=uncultured Ruegeria sp. TaxID=259304 RepID=UPI0026237A06|nr:hypothetical protein [uncultured Ruegeria sp.]
MASYRESVKTPPLMMKVRNIETRLISTTVLLRLRTIAARAVAAKSAPRLSALAAAKWWSEFRPADWLSMTALTTHAASQQELCRASEQFLRQQ